MFFILAGLNVICQQNHSEKNWIPIWNYGSYNFLVAAWGTAAKKPCQPKALLGQQECKN